MAAIPDPSPREGMNDRSVQVRASDLFALRSRVRRFESCWGRFEINSESVA
jgi:hypothetical protein